jgi:predicted N-acetyltransferase YhbS
MTIEVIPEWALTAGDDAAIAGLLGRSFATDFGGRSFFMQRHHLRLVWREGTVIGHMALSLRAVRLGGALVDVAGLAEVATDRGHRGKGIAAALLDRAITEARHSPARYLLLFGTAPLYAAAGFRPAANPIVAVDMSGAQTRSVLHLDRSALMVLPLAAEAWDEAAPLDLLGALI